MYTPLICQECWGRQSYYNTKTRKYIRYRAIPNISIFYLQDSKICGDIIDESFFGHIPDIVQIIFSYLFINDFQGYISYRYKWFDKFIWEQEETIFKQWFRNHHIIKEILEKYVQPNIENEKAAKTVFSLFNLTIYKKDFYLDRENKYHIILAENYVKNYRKKIRKELQLDLEMYLEENFTTTSGDPDDESSEERSLSPSY